MKKGMQTLPVELARKLQDIAVKKKATIISFVAPDEVVRVSPVKTAYASINEEEMYQLEHILKEAKSIPNALNMLHLVIHTPGGDLHTSYKIASFLRKKFPDIQAFVPYQAASGGTLICCAANSVYLGELGNLTPVDPQIPYKNYGRVSAYAFERAVEYMKKSFGELSPDEVFTPFQQMCDKFDPIIFDEMFTLVRNTYWYAKTLLEKSGYNRKNKDLAGNIAYELIRTQNVHSHVILSKDAAEMGLNVKEDEDLMETYAEVVSYRLKEKCSHHCIDHFFPVPTSQEGKVGIEEATKELLSVSV